MPKSQDVIYFKQIINTFKPTISEGMSSLILASNRARIRKESEAKLSTGDASSYQVHQQAHKDRTKSKEVKLLLRVSKPGCHNLRWWTDGIVGRQNLQDWRGPPKIWRGQPCRMYEDSLIKCDFSISWCEDGLNKCDLNQGKGILFEKVYWVWLSTVTVICHSGGWSPDAGDA